MYRIGIGSKTSTGGVVIEGNANIIINGLVASSVGHRATCPACKKGIGPIVAVGPRNETLPALPYPSFPTLAIKKGKTGFFRHSPIVQLHNAKIQLFNLQGQQVVFNDISIESGSNSFTLPVSVQAGVYLIRISDQSGMSTIKVLK
jgi:hypothetical protein